MTAELSGRRAVVTGGGRGIGLCAARRLAALGAHVVIADNGAAVDGQGTDDGVAAAAAESLRTAGLAVDGRAVDVSDERAVDELFDEFGEAGGVDIVVAAAGTLRPKPVWEMSVDDWDHVLATHARHAFLVSRRACRHWHERSRSGNPPDGRLVTMVAATGLVGRPDLGVNHAAAKGAVAALTLDLAHEMYPYGVTVNAVCAANVRGRMADHVSATIPDAHAAYDPGDPEHAARVIAYLCTDDASWINGQVIRVMGGLVGLYHPWELVASLDQKDNWSDYDVRVGLRRLFGAYPEYSPLPAAHRAGPVRPALRLDPDAS